jgi:hypothetical protein
MPIAVASQSGYTCSRHLHHRRDSWLENARGATPVEQRDTKEAVVRRPQIIGMLQLDWESLELIRQF